MKDESSLQPELNPEDSPPSPQPRLSRARKAAPAAMALVIGLAALSAQASESELVRDIQRVLHRLLAQCTLGSNSMG